MKSINKKILMETAQRIEPYIHRTPIHTSLTFNHLAGAEVFFKCENFQKVGAFKMRGATNAVALLTKEQKQFGVVTHSSGNFAQALALAAKNFGIKAYIVMPQNAPEGKRQAVLGYGADVIPCVPTLEARETTANEIIEKTGATFIHPYNDWHVIAGQATAAMEVYENVDSLDFMIAPIGGGGLISGTALASHFFSPHTKVIAAEPLEANDAYLSLQKGEIIPQSNPATIADGLRTSLGDITFSIIQKHVSQIVTITEQEIVTAMRFVWERMKLLIEPSSAVAVAAVMINPQLFVNKRVAIILSGGNADLDNLPF